MARPDSAVWHRFGRMQVDAGGTDPDDELCLRPWGMENGAALLEAAICGRLARACASASGLPAATQRLSNDLECGSEGIRDGVGGAGGRGFRGGGIGR